METLKSDAEVLYPSSAPAVPKETPAASSVKPQTKLEQEAISDADALYPSHRIKESNGNAGKTTEAAAPVRGVEGEKTGETDKTAADEQASQQNAEAVLFTDMSDVKLPKDAIVDDELKDRFVAVATENKLSKEAAQKLTDLSIENLGKYAQKLHQDATEMVQAWDKEVINDKEIGGAKLEETLGLAEKALTIADTKVPGFNGARFRADLVRTGMSNHPDMVRLMRYVGRDSSQTPVHDADVFYPNQNRGKS